MELKIGGMYSAYKVYDRTTGTYEWATDGADQDRRFMGGSTFAVRVKSVSGDGVSAVRIGDPETSRIVVPVSAFGSRIPDVAYLPGCALTLRWVGGERVGTFFVERVVSEGPEAYEIRERTLKVDVEGKRTWRHGPRIVVTQEPEGTWTYGKSGDRVMISKAWS